MVEVLTPLIIFGSIVIIIYLSLRHKERKLLISMGQSIDISNKKEINGSINNLKYGLVSVSMALGIFAGDILTKYTSLVEEAAYFSMIFLFGGIALLIFYFISNKKQQE